MKKYLICAGLALALAAPLISSAPMAAAEAVRWAPRPEDRANKSLMASYFEDDWTTPLGKMTIKRTAGAGVDHWIGYIYRDDTDEPAYVFEDLVPSEDASGLTGTWREAASTQKRNIRLVLNFSDGDKFAAGSEGYIGGLVELTGTRGYTPPRSNVHGSRLLDGNWCTEVGLLRVRVGGDNAVGGMFSDDGKVTQYLMDLKPTADNRGLEGTWYSTTAGSVREWVSMVPSADGRAMTASFGGSVGLHGKRVLNGVLKSTESQPAPNICVAHAPNPGGGGPAPQPQPQRHPQPEPQPGPQPQPQPEPKPDTPEAYRSLNKFDVRLDKVVEARGYPTRQVHVFVTIKNATTTQQYITSGFMRAVLTDTDGVGQERNQVWRANVEPAALFNNTPVVKPGAELAIRYVFMPDSGAVPATLTLSEGGKSLEFPVTGF